MMRAQAAETQEYPPGVGELDVIEIAGSLELRTGQEHAL